MDSGMNSSGAARPEGATDSSAQIHFKLPNIPAAHQSLQISAIMARKVITNAEVPWIFHPAVMTPSASCWMDEEEESRYRQEAAMRIQNIGMRLQVHQACVNTAITYMHRFYMFHSFSVTNNLRIASASFFLASRVEGCPRKAREIIAASHHCTFPGELEEFEIRALYSQLIEDEIQLNETFCRMNDVTHPQQFIRDICALIKARKDLEDTANMMCNLLLHMTTVCLYHTPIVIACVCVEMARAWMGLAFDMSIEGKPWFFYLQESMTQQRLDEIVKETLNTLAKYPDEVKHLLNFFSSQKNSTKEGTKRNDLSLEEQESPRSEKRQKESKDNGEGAQRTIEKTPKNSVNEERVTQVEEGESNGHRTQQIAEKKTKIRGGKKREAQQEEQSEDTAQKNKKRKKNANC